MGRPVGIIEKKPRTRRGNTINDRIAVRALWAMQLVLSRPTLLGDVSTFIQLIRDQFGCGKRQAYDVKLAVCAELREQAQVTVEDIAMVKAGMRGDIEALRRTGKHGEATLAEYRFAKTFGIAAPERLDVNVTGSAGEEDDEDEELTNEQLLALAALEDVSGTSVQ